MPHANFANLGMDAFKIRPVEIVVAEAEIHPSLPAGYAKLREVVGDFQSVRSVPGDDCGVKVLSGEFFQKPPLRFQTHAIAWTMSSR